MQAVGTQFDQQPPKSMVSERLPQRVVAMATLMRSVTRIEFLPRLCR